MNGMATAVLTDVCNDCCHALAEHDMFVGCRHVLTVGDESYRCVCLAFTD